MSSICNTMGPFLGCWRCSLARLWPLSGNPLTDLRDIMHCDLIYRFMFGQRSSQLWILYCDHTTSPGNPSTQASSIVMELWGKITVGILHLLELTRAKEVSFWSDHRTFHLCIRLFGQVNQIDRDYAEARARKRIKANDQKLLLNLACAAHRLNRWTIDRIHKWRPRNYSFVFVLIILTSLTLKQNFFWTLFVLTRLVRMISIKTKE